MAISDISLFIKIKTFVNSFTTVILPYESYNKAIFLKIPLHFAETWPNLVQVQTRLENATLASCDSLVFVAFHSFKNSSLKFPVANGAAFSGPERGQPGELYPNVRKFLNGNFHSIGLSSRNFRNFRLNGSHFPNLQFSALPKNVPENCCTIFPEIGGHP